MSRASYLIRMFASLFLFIIDDFITIGKKFFPEPNESRSRREAQDEHYRRQKLFFDVFLFPSTNQVRWRSPPHHSKGIADIGRTDTRTIPPHSHADCRERRRGISTKKVEIIKKNWKKETRNTHSILFSFSCFDIQAKLFPYLGVFVLSIFFFALPYFRLPFLQFFFKHRYRVVCTRHTHAPTQFSFFLAHSTSSTPQHSLVKKKQHKEIKDEE